MKRGIVLCLVLIVGLFPIALASASHTTGYHWARKSNPFFVNLVDSMDETRRALGIGPTIADEWSASAVAELNYVLGANDASTRADCPAPKQGRIRVCNYDYGATSWAGLATWWFDSNNHITKGTAKINDRYVILLPDILQTTCHEVGHNLGLGHQSGPTSLSCMESGSLWMTPNAHDYNQLQSLYRHTDSYRTSMRPPSEGGVFFPLIDEELAVTATTQDVGCVTVISWIDGGTTTQTLPIEDCPSVGPAGAN